MVATIGPATQSRHMLRKLIEAGMDVARLNFSHGSRDSHLDTIRNLQELSKELVKPVAVLQDLQGIKIRTGSLEDGRPVELATGERFVITTRPITGNQKRASTSYEALSRDVESGDRIFISDGSIELQVLSTTDTSIDCEVIGGGLLAQHQGINVPGSVISAPPLTSKDLSDLRFGIEQGVDFVALSFVRRADDVLQLKDKLSEMNSDLPVIAKLEKPIAIENLDQIIDACEGVMVARGDLGVEMSPEKVPVIQKRIIKEANQKGKLVITATQMLESMIFKPRPTRAEASDVANAVFDGSDALMLSGETAKGNFAIESVEMMAKIIQEAEKLNTMYPPERHPGRDILSFPEAVCDAAYHASLSINARAIVAFTQSGYTAKMISKYRPATPIFGFTPHEHVAKRLALYWGVKAMYLEPISNVDELIRVLEKVLLENRLVQEGDHLIILTGAPIIERGHTSLMKLHSVGRAP